MSLRLEGKSAIVTGAGSRRGIGRAIALALAAEGARVAVVDIDSAGAEATAAEIRDIGSDALAITADVSSSADVLRTVAETCSIFGGIDILVNNAGFVRFMPFLHISEELWDRTMAVNVKGYFLMGQAVAKRMVDQGHGGKILNLSSISAEMAGEEKTHYCTTKGAIKLLTQGMALELARHRINVNALAPGSIDTDIVTEGPIMGLVEQERRESSIPWGRMGEGKDLAGAAVFLVSSEAEYVTGASLIVDGGISAGSVLPPQFRSSPAN